MPDLTAPLLSLDASGTIAKTITYSHWRGIKYARQRVIPNNPRTNAQIQIRSVFRNLSTLWQYLPAQALAAYAARAEGNPYTDRNVFVSTNANTIYVNGTYDTWRASPGAKGGFAPTSMVLTPAANHIAVNLTPPTLPAGWTIAFGVAIALEETTDVTDPIVVPVHSDVDANPALLDITGLTGTTDYAVSAFVIYTRPDTITAYSVALTDDATTL